MQHLKTVCFLCHKLIISYFSLERSFGWGDGSEPSLQHHCESSDWPSDPLSLPYFCWDTSGAMFWASLSASASGWPPFSHSSHPSEPQMRLPCPVPAMHLHSITHCPVHAQQWEQGLAVAGCEARKWQSGCWLKEEEFGTRPVGHPPPYYSLRELKVGSGHFFHF